MKRVFIIVALAAGVWVSCGEKEESSSEKNSEQAKTETGEVKDDSEEKEVIVLASPTTFAKAIKAPGVVVVDVRTPGEVADGMIEGAVNINYSDENFKSSIDTLDRSMVYAVYCQGGGRSGQTAKMMEKMGFEKVIDLDGGFGAWSAEELPVYTAVADSTDQ